MKHHNSKHNEYKFKFENIGKTIHFQQHVIKHISNAETLYIDTHSYSYIYNKINIRKKWEYISIFNALIEMINSRNMEPWCLKHRHTINNFLCTNPTQHIIYLKFHFYETKKRHSFLHNMKRKAPQSFIIYLHTHLLKQCQTEPPFIFKIFNSSFIWRLANFKIINFF